jgi:acyl-coenzyme A thioesterase PaaI-like protein
MGQSSVTARVKNPDKPPRNFVSRILSSRFDGIAQGRDMASSLQEMYAPHGICFGCGPANDRGLRIRSYVRGDEVVATWRAEPHHQAFPGMLNGGIIGSLLDCHCNWTAANHLMRQAGLDQPPCTVTADYAVKLLRPTPIDAEIEIVAKVVESAADRATVEATLGAGGKPRATCRGTFVAVKPGHPAFHRWS